MITVTAVLSFWQEPHHCRSHFYPVFGTTEWSWIADTFLTWD